jgi:DNA modification methylase
MEIIKLGINELIPYEGNAKSHPAEQIAQIKRSIIEFGFNDPIAIDENNVIIEGHGRLIALKEMDYPEVECIRLSHMTEKQKKAYILAHNKLTMNTGFDADTLREELLALRKEDFDITLTGFNNDDVEEYFKSTEAYEDDFEIEVPPKPKSKTGDLWILGEHRLVCGDSTKKEDIDLLVNGEEMDLCLTDPPYNVDYGSKAESINKYGYAFSDRRIKNDYMPQLQFLQFLDDAFQNLSTVLKPGGGFYIFHASTTHMEFEHALRNNEMKSRQQLIWIKNAIVLGRQDYQWRHEPCLYGWKEGAAHYFTKDRTNDTIFQTEVDIDKMKLKELRAFVHNIMAEEVPKTIIHVDKPSRSTSHPTMKPIKLLGQMITNSSRIGDKVIDQFGGSGSTLITADQLERVAYLMELDEKFVDVIVNRYKNQCDINENDKTITLMREGKAYTYAEIMGDG